MIEKISTDVKKSETERNSVSRPTGRNMEIPKLRNGDSRVQGRFNDSDRPRSSSGMEQPKIRDAVDRHIPCINEKYAGQVHNGVRYEKRTITVEGAKKTLSLPGLKANLTLIFRKKCIKCPTPCSLKNAQNSFRVR